MSRDILEALACSIIIAAPFALIVLIRAALKALTPGLYARLRRARPERPPKPTPKDWEVLRDYREHQAWLADHPEHDPHPNPERGGRDGA